MIPSPFIPIANHLWQSTLFAVAVALLTLVLKENRAHLRYSLWLLASVKFLLPFSLLVAAGGVLARHTPVVVAPSAAASGTELSALVEPLVATVPQLATPHVQRSYANAIVAVVGIVWVLVFARLVCRLIFKWREMSASVRRASPLDLPIGMPVKRSPAFGEPGVFGIFRPVLLLPGKVVNCLTAREMESILAHELCHVRRRDNLAALIHMTVEAAFWFHPLVWWIGARLMEERERACDEEVLRTGGEPQAYAEGILKICELHLASPLACVAGVTGGDLKKRIEAIMRDQAASRLNYAKKAVLAVAAIAALAVPVLSGVLDPPESRAQSQEKLVFEVASVKRADPSVQGGGAIALAPGLLPGGGIRSRVPIFNLICWAYHIDGSQLSGGPSWIRSDRYAIEAKPEKFEGPEDPTTPIPEHQANRTRERVKALLADRFQLAIRTETKEAQVYVLSVAKGGHKLTSLPERRGGVSRGAGVIESPGSPISFLANILRIDMGRPVLDETGLDGFFKYKLEYRPENMQEKAALASIGEPVTDDDPRPSIFMAIKNQLGLELQSRKGPVTTVVIERIERPTEN